MYISLRAKRGHTFIELIIVLLVMGILAGAAVPRYSDSLHRFQAEAAATRIATDLKYAQNDAITKSTTRTATFIVDGDTYSISNLRDLNSTALGYNVDLSIEGYDVTIETAEFNSTNSVTFDFYGLPNASGFVLVESGGHYYKAVVSAGGQITVALH